MLTKDGQEPIGYIAVYRDGRKYENGSYITPLFKTWASAVGGIKRGYAKRAYERDDLRIIPVYM